MALAPDRLPYNTLELSPDGVGGARPRRGSLHNVARLSLGVAVVAAFAVLARRAGAPLLAARAAGAVQRSETPPLEAAPRHEPDADAGAAVRELRPYDDVPEAAQVVGYVPVAAANPAALAAPGVDAFPASLGVVAVSAPPSVQGFTAPPPVAPGAAQATTTAEAEAEAEGKCTGELRIEGHEGGSVQLISGNRWANLSTPDENTVIAKKSYARIYFAESCSPGPYDNSEYLSMFLLGKRMSWTVDLNGAGCGCNVGFYLASMRQNTEPSSCGDYYCDAHAVCGVACHEIDLQEANTHAWFSTLHASAPIAMGYGGDMGKPDYRDFGRDQYGPGSWCIDTNRPFRVVVSFHTMDSDVLKAMELYISQEGSDCEIARTLTEHPSRRHPNADGHDAFAELTDALRAGMTPVISYWADDSMAWLDGPGGDGEGPCEKGADDEEACPDTVRLYDFKVEPIS